MQHEELLWVQTVHTVDKDRERQVSPEDPEGLVQCGLEDVGRGSFWAETGDVDSDRAMTVIPEGLAGPPAWLEQSHRSQLMIPRRP